MTTVHPAAQPTNPYPALVELRRSGVVEADVAALFGIDPESGDLPMAGMPPMYAVGTYDGVLEVLRDPQRFSSSVYSWVTGLIMGRSILEMDPPEHSTYRSLIGQVFSRRNMERWAAELVPPEAEAILNRLRAAGTADLVPDLAFPFPVNVIARLLGLPDADRPLFHGWAGDMIKVTENFEVATAASAQLREYLLGLVAARRGSSAGTDLLSLLAHAEQEGTRLSDEDIVSFCRLLLTAGFETTYRSLGSVLYGLLTHEDQLSLLRNDRTLVAAAVDEGLRWECPLLTVFRLATVDTELGGVPIPSGSIVVAHLGSANHDETRWPRPEAFDITRAAQANIAFGAGPHVCIGMHLARLESRIILEQMLDALPNLRLDAAYPAPAITGTAMRSPTALRVTFDPS
jgi:cytochrome P450